MENYNETPFLEMELGREIYGDAILNEPPKVQLARKGDVIDFLVNKGIPKNSKTFNKLYATFSKDLPLR